MPLQHFSKAVKLEPQLKNLSSLPRAGSHWLKNLRYGPSLGENHYIHPTEHSGLIPRLYISLGTIRLCVNVHVPNQWVWMKDKNDDWEHRDMRVWWNGLLRRWKVSKCSCQGGIPPDTPHLEYYAPGACTSCLHTIQCPGYLCILTTPLVHGQIKTHMVVESTMFAFLLTWHSCKVDELKCVCYWWW